MAAVAIRGTTYPVVLPKLSDPRLHLAATITSLQVLGQVAFHFRLSIAQILISLATCAAIEVAITFRTKRVIMWPASALLTGNGVAFVLRVPGTPHGDWWSLRGWWIFVLVSGGSLLSKHVIKWRGEHVFNPSNIGLVACFLLLGRAHAEPLDFWWGRMSGWMVVALAIIVTGGFAILRRLHLLRVALAFWAAFAVGIGVLALAGHVLVARWHLGPITGFHFWWVLVTSPEVLVFLFFMITDPKTAPRSGSARVAYAISLGLLGALLIAPTRTEWAAKVGLLAALAIVCAMKPVLAYVPRRRLIVLAAAAACAYPVALIVVGNGPGGAKAFAATPRSTATAIAILPSKGVETTLDRATAERIANYLATLVPSAAGRPVSLHLEPGGGQDPPVAVAELGGGQSYRLAPVGNRWTLAKGQIAPPRLRRVPVLHGYALANVAARVGLRFTQGAFRYGVTPDNPAMMGGGLCWLDYDGDGWPDLFVVNGYGSGDIGAYSRHGGLPRTALFHNVHGRFVDVSQVSGAARPVRGEGCVAADFDGDGRPDLFISTAQSDELLWNNGDGTFTEGARAAGIASFGWHAGAAVADVNGDGRPDLYVAGYTEENGPILSSTAGFPTNHIGVQDELFLNLGRRQFREVGSHAGLDRPPFDHSLGAEFMDVNGDGRPDLYVANDEDPNRLYINRSGGPFGLHFVERATAEGVADSNAGMGIAAAGGYIFVSNSRRQTHAVYRQEGRRFTDLRRSFVHAFGTNLTGWGDSWVDLRNSGGAELILANGSIPITNVAKDSAAVQILAAPGGRWVDTGLLRDLRLNGRGLAAADYDNDGRVDLAVNSIGGKLVLLHNTSPSGHWLEVDVRPLSPGAVVTVIDTVGRRQVRTVQAGSSYLSSEDPRLHFGFGAAAPREVIVRYPWSGAAKQVERPPVDTVLTVER
jgi:Na+-translocating ferredoxin:NAD+ oxidoreductase RnfD subunit